MPREPGQPEFHHRGEMEEPTFSEWMEDQDYSLQGDFLWDLEGGLSRNWRKRLEQDDYDIGWPEGIIRSVRLPDGLRLWLAIDPYGIDVLTKYSRSDLAALGALTGYQVGRGCRATPACSECLGDHQGPLAKHEFEPIPIIGCISERVISINVDTTYDREVTGEDEHTLECHDEMLKGLINRSYVPYHCGIRSVALLLEPEDDHGKLVGMLQKTILPPWANY